jgi:hypothetical protein
VIVGVVNVQCDTNGIVIECSRGLSPHSESMVELCSLHEMWVRQHGLCQQQQCGGRSSGTLNINREIMLSKKVANSRIVAGKLDSTWTVCTSTEMLKAATLVSHRTATLAGAASTPTNGHALWNLPTHAWQPTASWLRTTCKGKCAPTAATPRRKVAK